MEKVLDLSGIWQAEGKDLGKFDVILPGTLDRNKIGKQEENQIKTRLTRLYTFEGEVRYWKKIGIPFREKKRLFLKVERTKELELRIDGRRMAALEEGTLSTPYLFEVTEYAGREVKIEVIVDNYYKNWPRDSMIASSASTDETQTNWNGMIGEFAILEEESVFVHSLRIYTTLKKADVYVEINGFTLREFEESGVKLELYSPAFAAKREPASNQKWEIYDADEKRHSVYMRMTDIQLKKDAGRWEEGEGILHSLQAVLLDGSQKKERMHEKTVYYGIRTFAVDEELRFNMNGRKIFLRGEANCCVFPEEGHPPMTVHEWQKVLELFSSYGVNCMRFHSWCPPEAAFTAADQVGMMMQPELSQWNYKDAFGSEAAKKYYQLELQQIQKNLANHPSFVMLAFGNELQNAEEGKGFVETLLDQARAYDSTRLYASSSNYHYGEEGVDSKSDFYTAMACGKEMIRATSSPMIGHLNQEYPSACHNYDEVIEKIRQDKKPVFGFEVGQYEILPDFEEIEQFQGVTKAVNLEIIKKRVEDAGLLPEWKNYVEATGELAVLCYKEEVEAVLRSEGMSGLSLLGIQDFPGQGTALVGMLDSHLCTKPYAFAQPEKFRSFFNDVVPLLYLKGFTYQNGEWVTAELKLANYSKKVMETEVAWCVKGGEQILIAGKFKMRNYLNNGLSEIGTVSFQLPEIEISKEYQIQIQAGHYCNEYRIWSYKKTERIQPDEKLIVTKLTQEVIEAVERGATVLLEPEANKENFPNSIGGQFTTDFWSIITFPEQQGGMGLVIDIKHPALALFPSQKHSNYQWWAMASGRPMILPKHIQPIVTVPDSCMRLQHMGLLFEASMGGGKLMVSSMGLLKKQQYPECSALLNSIILYLENGIYASNQSITREELEQIVASTF